MISKEHIILIENWSISDLYKDGFWNKLVSSFEISRSGYSNMSIEGTDNPIVEERFRKDLMIEFLWEILPQEYKISFFDCEYAVFYIWSSDIITENLIKLHDFLINREVERIPDLISSTNTYQNMVQSRNNAFSDMKIKDSKDIVLMKFYDKLTREEVISLNTPDYVMVSGINQDKVKGINDKLLQESYTLLYTMDYKTEGDPILIYVFHPKT